MFSNKIAMCCDTPLISTFIFPYNEWYCRVCKTTYPLLNVSRVESTQELLDAQTVNKKWFRDAAKDVIPPRSRRHGCKQCAGENHEDHASEEELAASQEAYFQLR